MRRFYITCMALSSFFIYNTSFADQHAFFVPENAFQQNTNFEQEKTTNDEELPSENNILNEAQKTTNDPLAAAIDPNKKIKKTLPYVKKIPKVDLPKNFNNLKQREASPAKISVPSKYTLEDSLDTEHPSDSAPKERPKKQLSALDLYSQKSVEQMLEQQPYPNKSLPKFKQRAALYDVELRQLYRRGTLPSNLKQEDALSKASSASYFEVP